MGLADLVAELKGMAMPEQEAHASILVAEALGPSEGYVYIAINKQPPMVIKAGSDNLAHIARTLVALSNQGAKINAFAAERTSEELFLEVTGLAGRVAYHNAQQANYQPFLREMLEQRGW